jgi:glycosyltransferase involved in cell wall biosynthesis
MNSEKQKKFIFIASPWGISGGGMFKVADYLIQTHANKDSDFQLFGLDTRGNKTAAYSFYYLFQSLTAILGGRIKGTLAGVHVNMAERLSVFRKGTIILFCRLIGIPTILHLHAAQFPIFYNTAPSLIKLLVRGVFKFPVKIIVLGDSAKKFAINDLFVAEEKIEIVTNGVPSAVYSRRKFDASKNFEILFLGNLTERKGVSDLLQAIEEKLSIEGKGFFLRLAGGGNIEKYKKYTAENGLEDFVSFEGWVDQLTASAFLANADVLILPSYDEGLPLAILEAMANGVAVICSPVGEIPHFLKDEINALFVTPGDVSGINCAISRLQNEPALREKMERTNLADFEDFYSAEKFYQTMVRNYERAFILR